jgi:hypothetical protein
LRIFVFLHVLTMFGAVALSGGSEVFLTRIAGTRDAAAIRTAFRAHNHLVRFIPILFLVGLGFGLIAIVVHGFNPFAPWLLLAYPLFVMGILTGALGIGPWADRVREAAESSGDITTDELEAAIANPRARYAQIAFWLIVAAIVFVMVAKPFS